MGETRAPIEVEFKPTSKLTAKFTECGHRGPLSFELMIFGKEYAYKISSEHIKKVSGEDTVGGPCPSCFAEHARQHAIRCCLCGLVIMPGDGVAFYHKDSEGIKKEFAEFVRVGAIGCMRWECCPSGGFYSGNWTTEGFRSAFGVE